MRRLAIHSLLLQSVSDLLSGTHTPEFLWIQPFSTAPNRFDYDFSNSETLFDWAGRKQSVARIEDAMGQADFWSNSEKAQATVATLKSINTILKPLEEAMAVGEDLQALEELAREESCHPAVYICLTKN